MPTLTSPLLASAGFLHAFFTRLGGVGEGPYESLSFSVAAGDLPERVRENRRRAARALDVEEPRLLYVSQVHGADVVELDAGVGPEAALERVGDVTTSADPSVACGVRTADCVPVLLADPRSGRVAAVHSGWRGTLLAVARVAVEHLVRAGARREELLAAVGPHIERCCFEVGADVAAQLAACSPVGGAAVSEGPALARPGPPTPRVDLRAIVAAQLLDAGLAEARVDHVGGCTFHEPARFFSFRRDGQRSGRLLSAVRARASGLAPAPR